MQLYLLTLLPVFCIAKSLHRPEKFPEFCSKVYPMINEISRHDLESSTYENIRRIKLELNFGETACLRSEFQYHSKMDSRFENRSTDNENRTISVLYVFQYADFHQVHPISHRYTYGVPFVSSECKCDCPGGEKICLPSSKYGNCNSGSIRTNSVEYGAGISGSTFYTNQDAAGCSKSNEYSNICCRINISAYKNWKFIAVDINQPTAFGELSYKIYFKENEKWTMARNKKFQAPFNRLTKITLDENSLDDLRIASKRVFQELRPGMYFFKDSDDHAKIDLRVEPELNRPGEWSLTKLGWFRFNASGGGWHMNKCSINLQKLLHVKVSNCKQQLYVDSIDAEFFLRDSNRRSFGAWDSDEPDNVRSFFGKPMNTSENWILDARPAWNGREIIVKHREPPAIELDFEMNTTMDVVHFLHHSPSLDDFEVEIRLDPTSSRFLKLTLINARGTVSSSIFESDSKRTDSLSFSVHARGENSEVFFIPLPNLVSDRRYVCLFPSSNREDLCRWAEYREWPMLNIDASPDTWIEKKSECVGCNEETFTWHNFLKYLNPAQWLDGISGVPEWMAFGVEALIYFAILLIAIAFCRRLICPLIKWAVCSGSGRKADDKTTG